MSPLSPILSRSGSHVKSWRNHTTTMPRRPKCSILRFLCLSNCSWQEGGKGVWVPSPKGDDRVEQEREGRKNISVRNISSPVSWKEGEGSEQHSITIFYAIPVFKMVLDRKSLIDWKERETGILQRGLEKFSELPLSFLTKAKSHRWQRQPRLYMSFTTRVHMGHSLPVRIVRDIASSGSSRRYSVSLSTTRHTWQKLHNSWQISDWQADRLLGITKLFLPAYLIHTNEHMSKKYLLLTVAQKEIQINKCHLTRNPSQKGKGVG